MAYPGQRSKLYVIPASETCTPNHPDIVFNRIVASTGGNLTLKGVSVFVKVAEDGAAGSEVRNPKYTGKLDEDQSIFASSVISGVDETTTISGGTSDQTTLKVFRNGADITSTITTKPSFSDVAVTAGEFTEVLVNAEGDGLKLGDVITFGVTSNAGVEISITLDRDDIQLAAGWYSYVSESTSYTVPVVAGEVIEGSFTSVATDATAVCKAYV